MNVLIAHSGILGRQVNGSSISLFRILSNTNNYARKLNSQLLISTGENQQHSLVPLKHGRPQHRSNAGFDFTEALQFSFHWLSGCYLCCQTRGRTRPIILAFKWRLRKSFLCGCPDQALSPAYDLLGGDIFDKVCLFRTSMDLRHVNPAYCADNRLAQSSCFALAMFSRIVSWQWWPSLYGFIMKHQYGWKQTSNAITLPITYHMTIFSERCPFHSPTRDKPDDI